MNLTNHSISSTKSQQNTANSRRKVFAVCAIVVLTAILTLLSIPHSATNSGTEVRAPAVQQSQASPAATERPEASAVTPDTDFTPPIVDYTYN